MKRKRVTLYLGNGKSHPLKPVEVEAYCNRCVYYKEFSDPHQEQGHCFFKPNTVVKDEKDWCSKFVPEREAEDWEAN